MDSDLVQKLLNLSEPGFSTAKFELAKHQPPKAVVLLKWLKRFEVCFGVLGCRRHATHFRY